MEYPEALSLVVFIAASAVVVIWWVRCFYTMITVSPRSFFSQAYGPHPALFLLFTAAVLIASSAKLVVWASS